MLTNDQIKDIVEHAFRPLNCVAQITDYDHLLKFKVIDAEGNEILKKSDTVVEEVRDETNLREVLSVVREHMKDQGFRLDE